MDVAAHAATRTDTGGAVEIPRAADEAILPRGQRPDRTDLRPVALVIRLGRLIVVGADDGVDATLDKGQLALAGNLLAETRAAPAEDAALPIEHDLVRQRHRLVEMRLLEGEAAGAGTVLVGLILKRALTALVADRAIEWMVDQQELQHAPLVLLRLLGPGPDDHAVRDVDRAGRLELRHLLHFHQAHPADGHRRHLRMRAEDRNVDARRLGGVQDQGALGDDHLLAIDRDGDGVGLNGSHYATASSTGFLKGQPFSEMCCWNSSRKYLITLRGNQVEASPSGQNDRPSML